MTKFILERGNGSPKLGLVLHTTESSAEASLPAVPFCIADAAIVDPKTNQVLSVAEGGDPSIGRFHQLMDHRRFEAFAKTSRPQEIHGGLCDDHDNDPARIAKAYIKAAPRKENTVSACYKPDRLEQPFFDNDFKSDSDKPPYKPSPAAVEYFKAAEEYYDDETDSERSSLGRRAVEFLKKTYYDSLETTKPLKLSFPAFYDSDGKQMSYRSIFSANLRNALVQAEIQLLPLREGQVGSGGIVHWIPKLKIVTLQIIQNGPGRNAQTGQSQPMSVTQLLGLSGKIEPDSTARQSAVQNGSAEVETEDDKTDDDDDDALMAAAETAEETITPVNTKRDAEDTIDTKPKKKKRAGKSSKSSKRVKSSEFISADE